MSYDGHQQHLTRLESTRSAADQPFVLLSHTVQIQKFNDAYRRHDSFQSRFRSNRVGYVETSVHVHYPNLQIIQGFNKLSNNPGILNSFQASLSFHDISTYQNHGIRTSFSFLVSMTKRKLFDRFLSRRRTEDNFSSSSSRLQFKISNHHIIKSIFPFPSTFIQAIPDVCCGGLVLRFFLSRHLKNTSSGLVCLIRHALLSLYYIL